MSDFRSQLRQLLADRHTPEAKALFDVLVRYSERRVRHVSRTCWPGLLGQADLEEIVGEVLFQLMSGSLARFRGETLGELLAFVRTVSDRCLWRLARRRKREQEAIDGERSPEIEAWNAALAGPDQAVRIVPDSPLSDKDQEYLRGLLHAGSKVEFARLEGVSRAAVTQRVQRIRNRISKLTVDDRLAVDAWLRHEARTALEA